MASSKTIFFVVFLHFLLLSSSSAHDINDILTQFPDFSRLNELFTKTQLDTEINKRSAITILAVDNAALSAIAGKPMDIVKKILSVHVALDYFDAAKLRELPTQTSIITTLYQTTGVATGLNGFLNVTKTAGGEITFGSAVIGSSPTATFVKVLATHPANISVIQVSGVVVPPGIAGGTLPPSGSPTEAPANAPATGAAPTPSSTPNIPPVPAPSTVVPPAASPMNMAPASSNGSASSPSETPKASSPAENGKAPAGSPTDPADTPQKPSDKASGAGRVMASGAGALAAALVVALL